MSSILIRGAKIPKNCAECRFCVNGFTDDAPMYECACQSYDNVSVLVDDHGKPFDFRPDWCPLVEVKEFHSDLIERGEAIKAAQRADDVRVSFSDSHIMSDAFEREIKDIETIIESEGDNE